MFIRDSFRDRHKVWRSRIIDKNIFWCATSVTNEPVGIARMNVTLVGVDTEIPFYVARGVTYFIWDFIRQGQVCSVTSTPNVDLVSGTLTAKEKGDKAEECCKNLHEQC